MTVSSRLTQERLAELLREVDALHDGLAPLTPEQKAAWLLPHLGAQEALPRSRSELKRRLAQGDPSVSESTVPLADQPPSSAGSSAVPSLPAVSGPWIVREDKHLGEPNPRSSWSVVRPLAVQGTWDVTACAYMTSREECEVVARALNEYAAAQAPQEESQ